MNRLAASLLAILLFALAACASGPVRRVSEPAASIQQLTVAADGSWTVALRLDNYSSVPMRFDAVEFALTAGGVPAGTLRGAPGISIGPESADIATLTFAPSADARLHIAGALADRRGVAYRLDGQVDATPEDGRQRRFQVERDSV